MGAMVIMELVTVVLCSISILHHKYGQLQSQGLAQTHGGDPHPGGWLSWVRERPSACASSHWPHLLPWHVCSGLRDPGYLTQTGEAKQALSLCCSSRVTSCYGLLQKLHPQQGSNCTNPSPKCWHPRLCLYLEPAEWVLLRQLLLAWAIGIIS